MTTPPTNDEALFQRFQEGDSRALRLLFERYSHRFRALVEQRLPPGLQRRISVADVVQEAQLAAFERRADFENRGPESFRRWVFGILHNKVREAVRWNAGTGKRAAGREVSREQRPDTVQFLAQDTSPSQAAIAAESADRLAAAIQALPPDDQEVLRLTRQEGLSLDQVAERMGRSKEAVRKLYGRALVRLKRLMDPPGNAAHG